MRFLLLFAFFFVPAVTQAANLTVYNLSSSALVVDSAVTFAPGVTALRLDVMSSASLGVLNGHFAAEPSLTSFAVDASHDAFIFVDGSGVQDFGVSDKTYAEMFMTGFTFIFVMGLLGTAMRWVRKIIVGGFEEGD